jgi:hypothetical protein
MSGPEKQVSSTEFNALAREVGDMKGLMSQMVDALTRITVIDERQQVVGVFMQKLDDRMARMEQRQHEAEVLNATAQGGAQRLTAIEAGFRELHIDRERDKARFQAVVWMVRGLWAVSGAGVVGMGAMLVKLWAGAGA